MPLHVVSSRYLCVNIHISVHVCFRDMYMTVPIFGMEKDMRHGKGESAWKRTCSRKMDMQHGHSRQQDHGHTAKTQTWNEHAAYCRHGLAIGTLTCSMDKYMLFVHVHVHASYLCPCCMTQYMLHLHVHAEIFRLGGKPTVIVEGINCAERKGSGMSSEVRTRDA
jgi:hypothetical protein